MTDPSLNLINAMTTEFDESKRWLGWMLYAYVAIYVVTLLGTFFGGRFSGMMGIVLLAIQIAVYFMRRKASTRFHDGERIKRMAMLQDGLGIQPSPGEITRICARLGFPDDSKRHFVGSYYSASAPAGNLRLLQIIDECSFWTSQCAKATAEKLLAALVAAAGAVVLAILFCLEFGFTGTSVVKVFITTVSFVAAGELMTMFFKFRGLSSSAESVMNTCEARLRSQSGDDALMLFNEYNCALSAAGLPIPHLVYAANQEKWNAAYAARLKSFNDSSHRANA